MPIIDDTDTESIETFKLVLSSVTNASFPSGDAERATGTILDDESRTVSFAASTYEVVEDNTTVNVVVNTSATAVHPIALTYATVNGTATTPADFLGLASSSTPVSIAKGQDSVTIPITIREDGEEEGNEAFTVQLTGFTIGANTTTVSHTTTVTIVDDDAALPVISLATIYDFISPGLPLTFTVSIEPQNDMPITVPITAHDETNSSLDFRTNPLIVGTDGTVTGKVFPLPSSTGKVTITLGNVAGHTSGPPLEVPIETPPNPATLTISGPSGPVAEGDMAMFTISANPTIDKDIIVEVDVNDFAAKGTDFVDDGNHFVELPANAPMKSFSVRTKTDTSASTDGVLVATILDGSGYTHSSPTNNTYAEVRDAENSTPVELTVSADITKVYQEEDIVFTITRTGDITNLLTFKYDLVDDEDFIDHEGMEIDGRIDANATSTPITLSTKLVDTSYTEPAGVTLRLNSVLDDPDLEYRLGSSTELTVEVSSSAKPVITLSIEPNYIARGTPFNLVATATPAPFKPTSVKVNLTSEPQTYPINNRYLLEAFRGEQTIEIAANAMRGEIAITSTPVDPNPSDGIVDDSDAIINATLQADSNYSIPSETAQLTERVGVLGTLPEVSISTRNLYEREDAGSFEVTIYTRFLPFVGLPLKVTSLTATETGSNNYLGTYDFSNLEIGHQDEIFIHDRFRGIRTTVNINSYPDEYRGPGEITIALADANNYTANAEASTQKVIIQDAERFTDRTISIDAPERVFEGEDIVVTLTNSTALQTNETIDVGFAVASIPVEYYNAADSTSSPVQFTSASLTQTVTIKTVEVSEHATDGTIYLRVLPGLNYEPPQNDQIEVQVVAKENLPVVSFTSSTLDAIYEGDDAVFTISATGPERTQPLPVSLTVAQGVSDDFILDPASTPTSINVATTGTGKLRIKTIADADQEDNGTITVTLSDSPKTYLLGSPATASVAVQDNDDPMLHSINITAVSNTTTEADGAMAMFAITATGGSTSDTTAIAVEVEVSEEGNFLKNPAGTRTGINVIPGTSGSPGTAVPLNEEIDNDIFFETNGKIFAKIVGSSQYGVGENAVAVVEITNDDTAPVVSIADASGVEGSGTTDGAVEFTVSLSKPSGLPVKVIYSTTDGTATTPGTNDDFIEAINEELIIPASSDSVQNTTGTITIITKADDTIEINEKFGINLTLPSDSNAIPGSRPQLSATGTILDDDSVAALTIADAVEPVAESAGSVNFVVTSTVPRTVTLNYQASEVNGGDFLSTTQENETTDELTFRQVGGRGAYVDTLIVPIHDDEAGERTGQIMVTMLAESGGSTTYSVPTNGDESAMATIWDDNAPELLIESNGDVTESAGSVVFTITARVSPNDMVTINYDVEESTGANVGDFIASEDEGTAATDSSKSKIFDFTAGKTTAQLSIDVVGNDTYELNSTVTVTLIEEVTPGTTYTVATSPNNEDTATIMNDETLPILSFKTTEFNADEEGGDFDVVVELDKAAIQEVSFIVATSTEGTQEATETEDYGDPEPTSGVIAVTEDEETISIPILSDNTVEGNETFTLTLSSLTGAVFSGGGPTLTQVITIIDNDVPTLTIADAFADEGDLVSFTPTLSAPALQPVVITYSTAPGGSIPVDDADYMAVPVADPANSITTSTITIQTGATTPTSPATIDITTIEDSAPEPDETFKLTFSATNATVPNDTATGTILNNDDRVLTISSETVDEDDATAELKVTLSPAPDSVSGQIDVTYTLSTTSAGEDDYTHTPATLEFEAGQKEKTISITIDEDALNEDDEIITVQLVHSSIELYDNGRGTVTIRDNDPLPTVGLALATPQMVQEGTNTNVAPAILVTLTDGSGTETPSGRAVTVQFALTEGTAKAPEDYLMTAGASTTLTFDPGVTSISIPVEIEPDRYDEDDESFTVTLSSENNANLGTASNMITIEDDDDAPMVSIAANAPVTETDEELNETIAVTLNEASGKTVTVPFTVTPGTATSADYTLVAGNVVFEPGTTSTITLKMMTIPFKITGDTLNEGEEQFTINLGTPTNGTLSSAVMGTVTITDNDPLPELTIGDESEDEGTLRSHLHQD